VLGHVLPCLWGLCTAPATAPLNIDLTAKFKSGKRCGTPSTGNATGIPYGTAWYRNGLQNGVKAQNGWLPKILVTICVKF